MPRWKKKRDIDHGDETSGLTAEERVVMSHLTSFWNDFITLEATHPHDLDEVMGAVHLIQGVLATRVARRKFPEYWATIKENEEDARNVAHGIHIAGIVAAGKRTRRFK